jgi:ABC-2 type transport system ATP-binding protein
VTGSDGIAIRARGLTRRFGSFVAVDRIDMDVPRASVTGFLGPNGSGKTTTLRMLCGLLTPSEGRIEVLGLSIPREAEALKLRIGYMTQKFSLYEDLTVLENLKFIAAVQGFGPRDAKARIEELLSEYRMEPRRNQLAGTMSGGQKQRLALACCVLHRPELLLLDEPTSAVDPESRREFWDHLFGLADAGTTLLVSTHFMDEAERCHRLAILDRGRLVAQGTPPELRQGIPERVLAVDGERPREAQVVLRRLPGAVAVAQIGTRLRVLAERELDAGALERALREAGLEARVTEVAPDLEDVFVSTTRGTKRPEAA